MSDVSVDVVADQDAGGGHAVIRLNGIYLLPPQSGFRIDPLDDSDQPADGWPAGEQRPQDVRVTPEGVELLVGPEIVDSPALQPGTPVVVSVPAVDVRSEIRWPTLAVSMAPRRRAVIVSAAQRAAEAAAAKQRAEADARAKAEAEENARMEAEARQRAIEERVRREEDERAQKVAADKAEADARQRAESAAALEANARTVAEARNKSMLEADATLKTEIAAADAKAKDVAREVDAISEEPDTRTNKRRRARETIAALTESEIKTEIVAPASVAPASTDEPEWAKAARDAATRLATIEATRSNPTVETENRGLARLDLGRNVPMTGEAGPSPVPTPPLVSAPPPSVSTPTPAGAPMAAADRPKVNVPKTVDELPPLPKRKSGVLPFLMGMLLPIAIGAAGFYAYTRNFAPVAPSQPAPAPIAATAPAAVATGSISPATPQRSTPLNTAAPAIGEVVKVGDTSPRGRAAKGVDLAQALALADRNLHGIDQAVDREEARFWLRKALSLSLHSEQMTWAVTQLGSLYASPVGSEAPDYDKARALWEISGANGDPVAHCFIASLFEHGLGVPADKRAALRHFQEAHRLGGCRGVDQAIARVSQ